MDNCRGRSKRPCASPRRSSKKYPVPEFPEELARIYERELARGNANRATLAVARKLVAWLLAVDKRKSVFIARQKAKSAAA